MTQEVAQGGSAVGPTVRSVRHRSQAIVLAALLACAGSLTLATTAHGNVINVNVNTDFGDPLGCELRDAIMAANTDSAAGGCPAGTGDDEINVPPGTYALVLGELFIDENQDEQLTIDGTGTAAQTVIQASAASRVFHIAPEGGAAAVEAPVIQDVTIRDGSPSTANGGGGILNQGNLTLRRSIVTDNEATGGPGGGIGGTSRPTHW